MTEAENDLPAPRRDFEGEAFVSSFAFHQESPGHTISTDYLDEHNPWRREPPRFTATVEFTWWGEPPEEIKALAERAKRT